MVRGLMRSDCVSITVCGGSAANIGAAKTGFGLGDRKSGIMGRGGVGEAA
jgi:hypothetical protein